MGYKKTVLLVLSLLIMITALFLLKSDLFLKSKNDVAFDLALEINQIDEDLNTLSDLNDISLKDFSYVKFKDSNILTWNIKHFSISNTKSYFSEINSTVPIYLNNEHHIYRGKKITIDSDIFFVFKSIALKGTLNKSFLTYLNEDIHVNYVSSDKVDFFFNQDYYNTSLNISLIYIFLLLGVILFIYSFYQFLLNKLSKPLIILTSYLVVFSLYCLLSYLKVFNLLNFKSSISHFYSSEVSVRYIDYVFFLFLLFFFLLTVFRNRRDFFFVMKKKKLFYSLLILLVSGIIFYLNTSVFSLLNHLDFIELNPNRLLLFNSFSYLVYVIIIILFIILLIIVYFFKSIIDKKFIPVAFSVQLLLFLSIASFQTSTSFVSILWCFSPMLCFFLNANFNHQKNLIIFIFQGLLFSSMMTYYVINIEENSMDMFLNNYSKSVTSEDESNMINTATKIQKYLHHHINDLKQLKAFSNSFFQERLAQNIENVFFPSKLESDYFDVLLIDTNSTNSLLKNQVLYLDSLIKLKENRIENDFFNIKESYSDYNYVGKYTFSELNLSFYILFKYDFISSAQIDIRALTFLNDFQIGHLKQGKIVYQYGSFISPHSSYVLENANEWTSYDENAKTFYQKTIKPNYDIFVSKEKTSVIYYTTILSFVILLFLLILLLISLYINPHFVLNIYTLKSKIYLSLILIVIVSLTAYAVGSIRFSNKLLSYQLNNDRVELTEEIFNLVKKSRVINFSKKDRMSLFSLEFFPSVGWISNDVHSFIYFKNILKEKKKFLLF